MSEKELLYIDDVLSHLMNMNDFLCNYIVSVEDENFKTVLKDLEKTNKDLYKKFYKLIEE